MSRPLEQPAVAQTKVVWHRTFNYQIFRSNETIFQDQNPPQHHVDLSHFEA
jgi:hypothetical protein